MIPENSDKVALTAQADIHRLYMKVIQPALAEFTPTADVGGETKHIDEFLDRARTNTHNSVCHELRRTFALVLAALFERQLRVWLSERMPPRKKDVEEAKWPDLIQLVTCVDSSITVSPVMAELGDLILIANAVRHGSGSSAEKLLRRKLQFWNHNAPKPNVNRNLIGNMRVDDAQLGLYATAVLKFWHLAGASSLLK